MRGLYPQSPYPDTEECRRLIEINSKWVTTGEYPDTSYYGSESKAKGCGDGDGVTQSTADASKSSLLLNKNSENLQKQGGNPPNKVDNLTFSKLSGVGQSLTDGSQAFSCDGLKEALDGASEDNTTRSKLQDGASLNANHVEVSDGKSASHGLSDGANLHDSGNRSDSLARGKSK